MAYERLSDKKIIATNLGSFIESQIQLISKTRLRRNLDDEAQFNRAVLEDNLTLEQQLEYRQDQMKRVVVGDKDERRRIRGEISTLKDLIEQKAYNDEYLSQIMDLNSGVQSIDRTINWLNEKLANTTDSTIQKSIKENLASLMSNRYEAQKTAITRQTEFANNDKTEVVITKQIANINSERAKALKAGNEDYVALLDLQLQSLNKTNSESAVQRTLLNFSVATMSGQSATSLLNQFNAQIENASLDAPITIGGTTYDNAKQFWELKRGDYLNDRSENGFFSRYQTELNEKVDYKSSRGILTNDSLAEVKAWYEGLKDRPELAEYSDRIGQDQQTALQTTGDKRAVSVLNEFSTKLDAKKAISDLAYMQDAYGIDQTLNYQKVVSSAAKEKEDQVNNILSTMASVMKDSPGMTNQQALEIAVKSGAGATFSPEELATKKASDVINESGKKSTEQQFGEDTGLTVNPEKEGKSFATPQLKDGDLIKMANSNTIYKYEGGQLHGFTGNWDETQFKAYTGKGFAAVKTVSDISGLQQGSMIKTTEIPSTAQGALVPHPDMLKYYNPQDIITVGQAKYLKQNVKPIWGNKLSPTEYSALQKQFAPADVEKKTVRAGNDIYLKV